MNDANFFKKLFSDFGGRLYATALVVLNLPPVEALANAPCIVREAFCENSPEP